MQVFLFTPDKCEILLKTVHLFLFLSTVADAGGITPRSWKIKHFKEFAQGLKSLA